MSTIQSSTPPGFPDGTITVDVPATCPELANIYNAPSCAFDRELTYIPMRLDYLPETGGEPVAWLIGLGVLLIVAAAATVFLSMFLTGAKKLERQNRG